MGLAMSRSLGDDIAHQAGVSSEPEILEHQIDDSDQVEGKRGRGGRRCTHWLPALVIEH